MKDKNLKKNVYHIAIRSNYCNCLFSRYKYKEAVEELKVLVACIETVVYPMLKDLEKFDRQDVQTRANQLVSNYYLFGNCLNLIQLEKRDKVDDNNPCAKYQPEDFLKRALKISQRFCKNQKMEEKIENCLKKIEEEKNKIEVNSIKESPADLTQMISRSESSGGSKINLKESKSLPRDI